MGARVQNRILDKFVLQVAQIWRNRRVPTSDQMSKIGRIRWIPASGPLMGAPVRNRILEKSVRHTFKILENRWVPIFIEM